MQDSAHQATSGRYVGLQSELSLRAHPHKNIAEHSDSSKLGGLPSACEQQATDATSFFLDLSIIKLTVAS